MPVTTYLAGAAQASFRDANADHPAALMAAMAARALDDAGVAVGDVDGLACVAPLSWTYEDLGAEVARLLGCQPGVRQFWVPAGGSSPLDLLHEVSAAIAAGEVDCVVIAGAEAMRTMRRARRAGRDLPWPTRAEGVNPMAGQGPFSSAVEQRHGLRMPIETFPLFENALRAARGRTGEEQMRLAARLLEKNAAVAAGNPHAWFRDAPSAEEIGTVTAENRIIAYPYTKRMNAIMDVDQAAATVVCSQRFVQARDAGGRCVAVLGGCGAEDAWFVSQRSSYAHSPAMRLAMGKALEFAGCSPDTLDALDLYSCFPSAVELGLEALGIDETDPRPFSLTGGLAFAGGPGNAYVVHVLAAAVEKLREAPALKLLLTGIGMANSKHVATVLTGATQVPVAASGTVQYREETAVAALEVTEQANGDAEVVTYTVEYDRAGEPTNAIFILNLAGGGRTIANVTNVPAVAALAIDSELVGRRGRVTFDAESGRNLFTLT